ncbi:hypothetical protein AAVH_02328 [Aphelenchoides avenae]|nr:hypothetical protein AAVH_02328 [Aphelenchus avenae]
MSASHKEKVANKTPVQCAKQASFTAATHRPSSSKNADSSHTDVTTGGLANDTTTRPAATISPPVVPPEARNAQPARETIVAPRKRSEPSASVFQEEHMVPGSSQSITPKKKPKSKPKVAAAQRAKTTGPVTQGPVDNQPMEVTEASTEPMQPSVSTEPAASTTPRASQQQAMKAPPKDRSTEFKATVQVLPDEAKPQGATRPAKPTGAGQGRSVGESQTRKSSSRAGQPHSVKTQPNTRSTSFKTTPAAEADKAELKPVTRSAPKTSDPAIHAQQDANSTTNVESTGEQHEPSASGKLISSRGGQHRVNDKV